MARATHHIENTASLRRGLRRLRAAAGADHFVHRKHRLAQKRIKTRPRRARGHRGRYCIENTASLRRGLRQLLAVPRRSTASVIENTASLRRGLRLDERGMTGYNYHFNRKHRLAQKRIKTTPVKILPFVNGDIENTASLRRGLRLRPRNSAMRRVASIENTASLRRGLRLPRRSVLAVSEGNRKHRLAQKRIKTKKGGSA